MKEKLLGISLEEKGNYGGNGLKTTRLREIKHPLIFVCMCMCGCVCVCMWMGVGVCFIIISVNIKIYFKPPYTAKVKEWSSTATSWQGEGQICL